MHRPSSQLRPCLPRVTSSSAPRFSAAPPHPVPRARVFLWKPRPRLTGPPPTSPASALPGESHSRGSLHGLRLWGHRVWGAGLRRGRHPQPQPCAAPCLEWGGGNASPREPSPTPSMFSHSPGTGASATLQTGAGAGAGGGPRVRPGGRPAGRARQVWGGRPPTAERLVLRLMVSRENPAGRGGADRGLQARPGFDF